MADSQLRAQYAQGVSFCFPVFQERIFSVLISHIFTKILYGVVG